MTARADQWAMEAAGLPIAFSQVREDPALDQAVLDELPDGARVFMIASGGDTAAWLAANGRVSCLHLVDVNPAQIALTRFKLHLLRRTASSERLAILGHLPIETSERAKTIRGILCTLDLPNDIFGPPELVAKLGPDYIGRYEILFQHLRESLADYREELTDLIALDDCDGQARLSDSETALGNALDDAFDSIMRIDNLVCLFGHEATQNARRPFSRHFAARTRYAMATLPARGNPFLAQLLLGSFDGCAPYDWMTAAAPDRWPEIVCTCSTAIDALKSLPAGSMNFIHLSNILDWLTPESAADTLSLAWKALSGRGRVVIRQLNSTLNIPLCEPRFTWLEEQAATLHRIDRSFFYRALFIGEKRIGI